MAETIENKPFVNNNDFNNNLKRLKITPTPKKRSPSRNPGCLPKLTAYEKFKLFVVVINKMQMRCQEIKFVC